MTVSDEIKSDFKRLGFEIVEGHIPKIKEIRKAYHRLSKEKHPDKHPEANDEERKTYEQEFQELLNSYNNAAEYVLNNKREENEEEVDEEENTAREEFTEVNIVKINTFSVTISIPTHHIRGWENTFKNKFGIYKDQTESNNGMQYKTEKGVNIKLWEKKGETKSTMLIDGKNQYIDFVFNEIPLMFREVVRFQGAIGNNDSKGDNKEKASTKPRVLFNCDLCQKVMVSERTLNRHKKAIHMKIMKGNEKKRKKMLTEIQIDVEQKSVREKCDLSCNICDIKFSRKAALEGHKRNKHNEAEMSFELRELTFIAKKGKKNSKIDEEKTDKEKDEQLIIALDYIEEALSENNFKNYTGILDQEPEERCEKCGQEFMGEDCFNIHIQEEMAEKGEESESNVDTLACRLCEQCGNITNNVCEMNCHSELEHGNQVNHSPANNEINHNIAENNIATNKESDENSQNDISSNDTPSKPEETNITHLFKKYEEEIRKRTIAETKVRLLQKRLHNADKGLNKWKETAKTMKNQAKEREEQYKDSLKKSRSTLKIKEKELLQYKKSLNDAKEEQNKNIPENSRKEKEEILKLKMDLLFKEAEYKNQIDKLKTELNNKSKKKESNAEKLQQDTNKENDIEIIEEVREETSKEKEKNTEEIRRKEQENLNKKSKDLTRKFICGKCDFRCKTEVVLKGHNTSKHSEKKLKCNECDFRAVSEEILNKHMKIAMAHKKDQSCKYFLNNQCRYGDRCRYKHFSGQHNSASNVNNATKVHCNLCKFWTLDKNTLEQHVKIHQRNSPCKFFMRGFCRNGISCRFDHKITSNYNMNLSNAGKPFESQRQCKYMSNCFLFPNCGFAHNELCRYQENCRNRAKCRFVHLNTNSYQSKNNVQNGINFLGMTPKGPFRNRY